MRRGRWQRGICTLLSSAVLLSCFPLTEDLAVAESVPCYSVISDISFEADSRIVSVWGTQANLEFSVTNLGSDVIHNWFLTFDLPYAIDNVWNAAVYESGDQGTYTLKNTGWNQDILPDETIQFGMSVSASDGQTIEKLPSFYLLNTAVKPIDSSQYTLTYHEYSNWGNGFNGSLVLTNKSNQTIEDWTIGFSANREITEVAGAELRIENDHFVVTNNGSNQNIAPYSSINMTVNGNGQNTNKNFLFSDVTLCSICCAYNLTEDDDHNGIADYLDYIDMLKGNLDIDSDGDGIPDSVEIQIGSDPYSKDSDNDGVDDSIEIAMGLDPMLPDSDGNGIPDSQEDSDSDGLSLEEELQRGTKPWIADSDSDGLSDGEEVYTIGSDPLLSDSDSDGIGDGDERILGLNPLLSDSDGDGTPDTNERILQTRSEEINDVEKPAVTEVEVTLEGTGCLETAMSITDVYKADTYSSDLVGLVSVPMNIEYEGDFDEAEITFHYDEKWLSQIDFNVPDSFPLSDDYTTRPATLGIFYYDEENGVYVDCGAEVDTENHTVTCTTTHFSTYMVVDEYIWYQFWTSMKYVGDLQPSHEGYKGIDYVLEIPCVNTMNASDIAEMNAIANRIIDNMHEEDHMVIRGYSIGGFYTYDYTSDTDILKKQVSEWPWNEGDPWVGYTYTTPELLGNQLSGREIFNIASSSYGHDPENELVVIAFHNSTDIDCEYYSADCRTVREMTAYIFTLSNGEPTTESLKWLNHAAGGGVIDCEGKTADEVYDEFAELYEKRQGKDEEYNYGDHEAGDGLWDIYEEQGMLGSNGQFYYSNPLSKDSDGDGLLDASEMGSYTVVEVNEEGNLYVDGNLIDSEKFSDMPEWICYGHYTRYGKGRWTIYRVKAEPMVLDTDGDFYSDGIDPKPKKSNIRAIGLEGVYDPRTSNFRYVQVHNHPGCGSTDPSIGGNQKWFGKEGWNREPNDLYIQDHGCGLIAFSDLVLYHFTDIRDIDFDQYYNHVHETNDYLSFCRTQWGYYYGGLCTAINQLYFVDGEIGLAFPVFVNTNQKNGLLSCIARMIKGGKPVITSVFTKEELKFYRLDNKGDIDPITHVLGDSNWNFYSSSTAKGHYFSLTGMIYDDISNDVYLRVSDAGREEYIFYSEYLELIEAHRQFPSFYPGEDLGDMIICY
ncbi:MAG: cellulose binding domain-containing protein [Clostridiales bacterium]|nr:cellulose binding domain-containing protein [Clostridiales bacterium]